MNKSINNPDKFILALRKNSSYLKETTIEQIKDNSITLFSNIARRKGRPGLTCLQKRVSFDTRRHLSPFPTYGWISNVASFSHLLAHLFALFAFCWPKWFRRIRRQLV
ncbi:hypothetical protein BpHYR1_039358 [Brachionus plicatilis]|uniref:Uncharacterized protein n=1 Tax=Brachionus plicatilis TaxID=10195 RepID=A0A3M7QWK0_BRAPC|nr:hypothetical protein BpHYR1_039358 [Brachionus plicatilis]